MSPLTDLAIANAATLKPLTDVAAEMGRRGIEQVRQNFLLTRNLRDYLLLMLATSTSTRTIQL